MSTPRKHAELIKAWADGAEIQYFNTFAKDWQTITGSVLWYGDREYRIKPVPKPDVVMYSHIYDVIPEVKFIRAGAYTDERMMSDNIKAIFDGETGKLKAVELLSNQ